MDATRISWTQVLGNPYRYGLHPNMLKKEGYVLHTYARIVGQRMNEEPIAVIIYFDEKYVKCFLQKTIFEKLMPVNYDNFEHTARKAWDEWNEDAPF
jgi:hypothetical protein